MQRKSERIDMERIESYLQKFGPLATAQLATHFGLSGHHSLNERMKLSSKIRFIRLGNSMKLLWYHVDGRKPEVIKHQPSPSVMPAFRGELANTLIGMGA